jgi:DNA modification methylase
VTVRVLEGDVMDMLPTLESESAHCVVTSPPYFQLRDYGVPGQIGLEKTPEEYIAKMVAVFREVRRVLRKDATCWINISDSYAASGKGPQGVTGFGNHSVRQGFIGTSQRSKTDSGIPGCKPKDLIGIPWMLAFALRADGWYLRADIIWSKPNPMPESVTDRPTKAHEYLFLLSKSRTYFFDQDAVREPTRSLDPENISYRPNSARIAEEGRKEFHAKHEMSARSYNPAGRNIRSVWEIATAPFPSAHFATFPPALVEPCIKAGCPSGGTVLDPFFGAGTTGLVADRLGRNCIGIELSPTYAAMARARLIGDAPMFADVVGA